MILSKNLFTGFWFKIVEICQKNESFGRKFLNMSKLRFQKVSFGFEPVSTSLILFFSQYFGQKVIFEPKFEIFSEILWRENQPCDTIFGLFVYHGRMWLLKLIKPNDFAPSRISRSIFGQFRSN